MTLLRACRCTDAGEEQAQMLSQMWDHYYIRTYLYDFSSRLVVEGPDVVPDVAPDVRPLIGPDVRPDVGPLVPVPVGPEDVRTVDPRKFFKTER
jgi:hypothetical protein